MSESDRTDSHVLELLVEGPAAGGSCVARHQGQVVFVAGALPGERVRARIVDGSSRKFLRAEVSEVLEASAHRVPDRRLDYLPAEAPALVGASTPSGTSASASPPLFGGMEFAHSDLDYSRELKAQVLTDQLSRIGHLDVQPTVAAAPGETTGLDWRTRVQLAVDDDGRPGMLAPRSHEVVPVTSAPLACPEIAEVEVSDLRVPGATRLEFAWAGEQGAVIVRGDCGAGPLSELSLRLEPQWSILAETGTSGGARRSRRAGRRPTAADGRGRRTVLSSIRGTDILRQTVYGRSFRVAADGFWQVHRQAPSLLSSVVTSAVPTDARSITDLYCGVGLLGIGAAATTGARLHGVESAKTAITAAKENAQDLDARFTAARVDEVELPDSEVIILDPPRAGAGRDVTGKLVGSNATTIIYVSCDSATLARDLQALTAGGFAIGSLRGFDLFPLTAHLETVTVLHR